jgi:hypothetical protein
MALLNSLGMGGASEKEYDPHHLSSPQVFLWSMVIFLAIVAFIAVILTRQISNAFATNPGLNGLILGVLLVGILLSFGQVIRLFREIRWVNSFRAGTEVGGAGAAGADEGAAGALVIDGALDQLDALDARFHRHAPRRERDISRYLVGLLVFLGLLGTFWGLLGTIGSIGDTIQALDPGSGDTKSVLDALKSGLSAPLSGMGTAFSSSLFGLSGSLVLGFLDLQAGRAQNRFYTELENWLSTDRCRSTSAPRCRAHQLRRRHQSDVGTAADTAGERRFQPARRGRDGQSGRRAFRDW